ncbi:MAG TPA: glycosyltransferase family 2 protein [Gemmatimonadales bacterium]|jgi:glycosyltransferase involved in cell wall biosynthesis|nr:glycosyltransferase family 2 protein [Gemmatimonadales bacterium]
MIYFCVPTFDEAPTVGLVLWKIRRVLEDSSREYQLLVGDDASTDNTAEVLEGYAKVLPLTVLHAAERQGYAATVESLLKEALRRSDRHKRDVAILIPADFTFDPAELPEFLKRLDSGADLVVGEATLVDETDRWRRTVRAWAPRILGRKVRVPGVRDVVSSVAAIRLVAIRNAFRDRAGTWLTTDGWAANAQLMAWAAAGSRRAETVAVAERTDRRQRTSRHTPWERFRALWSARGHLLAPPRIQEAERPSRPAKEAA